MILERPKLPDKKCFEYFSVNPPEKWGFEQYEANINQNSGRPLRMKTIKNSYIQTLEHILNLKDIDENLKKYVNHLLNQLERTNSGDKKKEGEKENERHVFNNYGTVGYQGTGFGSIAMNTLPQKRQLEEEESSEEEYREPSSNITETTDASFVLPVSLKQYGELLKTRKYILSMREMNDINFTAEDDVFYMDENISLDERLLRSCIKYIDLCPDDLKLKPAVLSDNTYTEIRKWRRCQKEKTDYFPPAVNPNNTFIPEDIYKRNLGAFLVYLSEALNRPPPPPNNNNKQSEIDFCVQNVSILLKFVFNSQDKVHMAWEHCSVTNEESTGKKTTNDFIIYDSNQELGTGEVKKENTDKKLEEEDRARLGEAMKKQLHERIKKAKFEREFSTFGMFVDGNYVELYCMKFSKEDGYRFFLLDKIKLPTLGATYVALDESLEILFSFKELIMTTLPNLEETEQPYIYRHYYKYFKPTVTFLE